MCETYKDKNIIVHASDTDVLIILLAPSHSLPVHIWLDLGLSSNNTQRYIDVSRLAEDLGQETCAAILGLHVFTGCDYTASFMRKSKIHPLDIMLKIPKYISSFAKLGDKQFIPLEILQNIESFVCCLYGYPKETSVNMTRHLLFQHKFAPRPGCNPLDKIKGIHPSSMPPCKSVLMEKLKRANLVCATWKQSLDPNPHSMDPKCHGWQVMDGCYKIMWFTGKQLPDAVCDCIESDIQEELPDNEIEYSSSDEEDES